MAYNTKINWTDATVNFWTGCQKVSPGCKYCYMYRDKERYGQDPKTVLRTADKTFYAALKWKEPRLIFTCSWSDFFIKEADEWRADAWEVIRKTPQHNWQILTKRPERISECLPHDWGKGWPNVWLGISAENEKMFDERVPVLLNTPAMTRFVSIEPLLERIEMTRKRRSDLLGIDWVIIGGESGSDNGKYKYRPCEAEWMMEIVQKMPQATKVFVKQLGTYLAKQIGATDRHGGNIDEFPAALQFRQMPPDKRLHDQSLLF